MTFVHSAAFSKVSSPAKFISHPGAIYRTYSQNAGPVKPDHRASNKLFEDAAREEAEDAVPHPPSKASILEGQNRNWTGDESMQDAVLRMLVDKYKPLRSGPIRSADEKLKRAPPQVHQPEKDNVAELHNEMLLEPQLSEGPSAHRSFANVPLLPSIEGHQPWHTTFKVPSHASSSIHYGKFTPSSSKSPSVSSTLDERAKRKEKETKKRMEQAGRLSRARESTLDYRLGIKGGSMDQHRRPNPVTMKGWASLVEDRIEKARLEGQFKTVKGRGQPIVQTVEDKNPFIAREEFLMNRIVQQQGAAPPWVEIQGELETAITSFREIVKQSWTRRAIRMLTASQPAALLPALTLDDVTSLRDLEWEARERGYHDTALEEVNSLVRKYNGLAPYAVRRPYYMRAVELERVYRDCGEDILRGIAERISGGPARSTQNDHSSEESEDGISSSTTDDPRFRWRFRDMIRDLVAAFRGR